jgi:hypothetical protein
MREPLGIIQHADHPKMIESTLRLSRINRIKHEGDRAANKVETCNFGFPKIIGFHRPIQFNRFHNQRRKFRHPGADVETAAAPSEFLLQQNGDPTSEPFAGTPLRSPKLVAALITVDPSQCLVIEPVEKEANGLNGLRLKSAFHDDACKNSSEEYF